MILGAEIGLIIFAIIAMVRGKLVLTKNRVVTGTPARLLAIFGFLPLPLSLVILTAVAAVFVARGQPVDRGPFVGISIAIELGVLLGCIVAVYGIGLFIARPPEPEWRPRRRRPDSDEEDEETLPDEVPSRPAIAGSTEIQPGAPPQPTSIAASPAPRAPRAPASRPPIAGPEASPQRPAVDGSRRWIIALVAVGALSVCCAGIVAVGGGVALWTWHQRPVVLGGVAEVRPKMVDAVARPKVEPPPKVEPAPKAEPARPQLKLPPIPVRPTIPVSQVIVKTTVPLPARPSRVAVGGGGRYLWFYFPKLDKCGQLDAVTGKLTVNYGTQNDTEIAAGLTRILSWSPKSNTLACCDVATGAQQRLFGLKLNGKVTAFCMGTASEGPLLIATESEFKLIDIETGEVMPLPNDQQNQPLARFSNCRFWADGTGRAFGRAGRIGSPNGVASLLLEPDRGVQHYQHQGTFYNVPSPDGRYLYAGGHGVLTIDLKTVPGAAYSNLANANARDLYLPAHHGPYYFHLPAGTDPGPGQGGNRGIRVFKLGNPQPIKLVPDAETPTLADMQPQRELRIEDTVHLIPEAKLLVVIPKEFDRLLLHPVDL